MKKIGIVLCALTTVLMTGCGSSKMTCVNEEKMANYSLKQTQKYTFDGKYATEIETILEAEFSDENKAKLFSQNYTDTDGWSVKLDGNVAYVSRIKKVDENNLKAESNTKEKIKAARESENYTCK